MSMYHLSLVFLTENPTLGAGRVLFEDDDEAPRVAMLYNDVVYPCRRDTRLQMYPLPRGRSVEVHLPDSEPLLDAEIVRELTSIEGERRQFVVTARGRELSVDEAWIVPQGPDRRSLTLRLGSFDWCRPHVFFARRSMLQQWRLWYEESEGLPTLTGARLHSLAHQTHAVQRVLWERNVRFILADEVGLGKTVEAGLIMQALLASEPDLRVLLIAPGSMTRQWLCELYLKFGGRAFANIHDLGDEIGARAIVSTTTLMRQREQWSQLSEQRWGLVVIDEAHQHPPGTPLYELLTELAVRSERLLVLSATPSKRNSRGLLGLLALVAPETYQLDHEARFCELLELRRALWDTLDYHQQVREAADFAMLPSEALAEVAYEWAPLLAGDETAEELLARVESGERTAFHELQAYVQERYRVDHRIVRTRRKTLELLGHEWCARELEVIDYEPCAEESLLVAHVEELVALLSPVVAPARRALIAVYLQLLQFTPKLCVELLELREQALRAETALSQDAHWWAELLSDPSPAEDEQLRLTVLSEVAPFEGEFDWLEHALALGRAWCERDVLGRRHRAAIRWISDHLERNPEQKILVFTGAREVALAFADACSEALDAVVEAFHHVSDVRGEERLKQITFEFQHSPQRPVLVSDELGGEGRNFQMAEAVIHLDCPWAVSRLEQRIGRLDRIGREAERPVRSVVVRGRGTIEAQIDQTHAEFFRVHERSIGGLEFVLPQLQTRLYESAVDGSLADHENRENLRQEIEAAFDEADDDFDRALDTSRTELERASELVELLVDVNGSERAESMMFWARALGLKVHSSPGPDGKDQHNYKWERSNLADEIPGLPENRQFYVGTFDRYHALEREDLHFFAPGHVLVDALVGALRTSYVGRLTIFRRELGSENRGSLFALVLVRFDLEPSRWNGVSSPFDPGLLTRARSVLYPEVIEKACHLDLAPKASVTLVQDPWLRHRLQADYSRESVRFVRLEDVARFDLGTLIERLEAAIEVGREAAARERLSYASEAREELEERLAPEMGFLRGQLRRNEGDSEQLRRALEQRQLLLDNLGDSQSEIAAVAIIEGL